MKKIIFFFVIFILPLVVSAEETKTGLSYLNGSTVIISNNMGADVQLTRQTTNQNQLDIKTIIFQSSYNFRKNVLYEYEVELNNNYITNNINKFSLIGYNMTCSLISIQGLNASYLQIRFTCPNDTSYIQISLSNLSNNSITTGYQIGWNSIYLWSITDQIDLGPIINNDTQNTQNIINNNNQNTQDIINSNQVCSNIDKYNVEKSSYFLNENGEEVSNGGYGITSYFKINSTSKLNVVFNRSDSASICFYNVNKSLISCIKDNQLSLGQQVTIPSNADYFRATINLGDNKPTYQLCTNGSQAVSDGINDLDNTIKNDDIDSNSTTDTLDDLSSSLPTNSVISDLILLPVTMLQAIVNSISGTCSNFSLGSLMGTELVLPCINIQSYLGNTIWTFVDLVFCGSFIIVIRKKFIQIFENISNLRNGGNEVE